MVLTEYIVEKLNDEKWEEPIYVQKLIRCKDCMYWDAVNPRGWVANCCSQTNNIMSADGFCSFARLKDETD